MARRPLQQLNTNGLRIRLVHRDALRYENKDANVEYRAEGMRYE